MSLLKVIMTSATVATTLFTGVSSNGPAADLSVGQYAEDEAVITDAGIYDAICAALTETYDNGESVLARHFWASDVLMGKADGTLPEYSVLAKMQGTQKKTTANADNGKAVSVANIPGNEIKNENTGSSRDMGDNVGASSAVDHSTVQIMADAGKVSESVPGGISTDISEVSVDNSSANIADSKGASLAVNTGNVSENTGSNETVPVPVTPNAPVESTTPVTPTVPAAPTERTAPVESTVPVEPTAPVESTTPVEPTAPAVNPTDAGGSGEAVPDPVPSADNGPKYDHTTSIYTNDESTLLRVEYYDENNKLFEYSSVDNYDKDTNSYTETVYKWDNENDTQVTVRTDTYVNGELVSSDKP